MSSREFWNLAGRAGRIGHDSVGVVGLAEGQNREVLIDFVSRNTGALVSRLVSLLEDIASEGTLGDLSSMLRQEQWDDFRCYVAHLWAEKKRLDAVLADSERLLRQTYGYTTLRSDPSQRDAADALLEATRWYAHQLADMPSGIAQLADATGFSPEGVIKGMGGIRNLESKLTPDDWLPESLFGSGGQMAPLFGVMLKIPQLKGQLEEIGGEGFDHTRISSITRDWVNGKGLSEIAETYFPADGEYGKSMSLSNTCKAIYRAIVNGGTWGMSALAQLSGLEFESLPDEQRRRITALPAMIYHGVRTEDAVLMRMNSAPRSVAESLGDLYREFTGDDEARYSVGQARSFLRDLDLDGWDRVRPSEGSLSADGYKRVWSILSGEGGP